MSRNKLSCRFFAENWILKNTNYHDAFINISIFLGGGTKKNDTIFCTIRVYIYVYMCLVFNISENEKN